MRSRSIDLRRLVRLAGLACLPALVAGSIAAAVAAEAPRAISVVARPVALDIADAERTRVGKLRYRGGVSLTSSDGRFGGWSDLWLDRDGRHLVAISDRGFWLEAKLTFDWSGAPSGLDEARLGGLIDLDGRPITGFAADAEALVRLPDGGFLVAFERRHRIWHYPSAEPPFSLAPTNIPPPPELSRAPPNGGLEALARLSDGRLFALAEELVVEGANVGWIGDGKTWRTLGYVAAVDYKPTSASELPDGDVLVLERRYTRRDGPGARLVRLARRDIKPGARLAGEELARIEPPLTIDNFEGVAVWRESDGTTRIYIISDDNYSLLQRTLLLAFDLVE